MIRRLAQGLARTAALLLIGLEAGLAWADTGGAQRPCPPEPEPISAQLLRSAAAQARDRGVLWRVTRDGRSSYLYGTLHVGRAEWMAPGPLLQRALRETDLVALELDPLDETVQREIAAAMAQARAETTAALPRPLEARLQRQWDLQCLPAERMGQGPAVLRLMNLMAAVVTRDGIAPVYGSEILLSLTGRGMGRAMASLETAARQLEALRALDAEETQAYVASSLDELEGDRVRPVLLRLVQLWEQADLDEISRYPAWCACLETAAERKLMKKLLDERNPGLAERIDTLHRQGRKVLAAVGALHMTGPTGLPALLAARGYTVERLR